MGYYISPPGQDKEVWLERNGIETFTPCPATPTTLPVCLVDNGFFTAAGIGYSAHEVDDFNRPDDHRPKRWFMVKRELLRGVSDLPEEHY